MAITRKLESKVKLAPKVEVADSTLEEKVEVRETKDSRTSRSDDPREAGVARATKRVCQFCTQKTVPLYTDSTSLRRYLSDRGRIQPRARTGVCAKHQRGLSREIKYARHLSLLPFTVRV